MFKRLFGTALVLGGATWLFYDHFVYRSERAIVVAPTEDLRAPADGIVTHALERSHSVRTGAELATLKRVSAVDAELRTAEAQLEVKQTDARALKAAIALGTEIATGATSRRKRVLSGRSEHLKRLVAQTEATVTAQQTMADSSKRMFERAHLLCGEGLMPSVECDDLRAKADVHARELDSVRKQLDVNQYLLQLSERGLDVGQGSMSESSFSRQQQNELSLKLASLRTELATVTAEADALKQMLARGAIQVTAPADTFVWSVSRRSGSYVNKGEVIARLADCHRAFVMAAVRESQYNDMFVGQGATLVIGKQRHRGKVVQLLGPKDGIGQLNQVPLWPIMENDQRSSSGGLIAVQADEPLAVAGGTCPIASGADVRFDRPGSGDRGR